MLSLQDWLDESTHKNIDFADYVLSTQAVEMEVAPAVLLAKFSNMLAVMRASKDFGLTGIKSKSKMVGGAAKKLDELPSEKIFAGDLLTNAIKFSLAVAEANAAMGKVVAAPTAGASGVLPGALFATGEYLQLDDQQITRGLIVAGAIGIIIATRASISGAIGGCQAECGSASSMAAGAIVYLLGGSNQQIAHAAAIAMKNMLGLVCDPVAGLVEVPCVKRNAGAVGQAIVAAQMALAGIESTIPVDEVIDAMKSIGDSLPCSLKETSCGGLAITNTAKIIAENI